MPDGKGEISVAPKSRCFPIRNSVGMLSSPRRPACAPVCAWRDPARCGAALAALHSCRRAAWHLRNLHRVTRRPRTAGNVLIGRRPLRRLTTRPARKLCRPRPCQWPRAMKPVLEVILDQPPAPTACVRDDDCLRCRSIRERRRQGSYGPLSHASSTVTGMSAMTSGRWGVLVSQFLLSPVKLLLKLQS
jgi:hypothetical protein